MLGADTEVASFWKTPTVPETMMLAVVPGPTMAGWAVAERILTETLGNTGLGGGGFGGSMGCSMLSGCVIVLSNEGILGVSSVVLIMPVPRNSFRSNLL